MDKYIQDNRPKIPALVLALISILDKILFIAILNNIKIIGERLYSLIKYYNMKKEVFKWEIN